MRADILFTLLPKEIEEGSISKKEGLKILYSFICKNYKIFKMERLDEDFREDVFLRLIERGDQIFDNYRPSEGTFFNYIYCQISGIIKTIKKDRAKKAIKENYCLTENSNNYYEEYQYKYSRTSLTLCERPPIPYSANKVTPQALRQAFFTNSKCKRIIILALKSSFYINDSHIEEICRLYKIDGAPLYDAIQRIKERLSEKARKKDILLERRNYAYYHHKKYNEQIQNLDLSTIENIYIKNELARKMKNHERNWASTVKKLREGCIYVRPSNKDIADILEIPERQVSYCLQKVKEDLRNLPPIKIDDEEEGE